MTPDSEMPRYLRCLICSVPMFNVNCGSPDCVRVLHALCSSEATHRSHVRSGSADYLLVPVSHQAHSPPCEVIRGPPATTDISLAQEACPSSFNPFFSAYGYQNVLSGSGNDGVSAVVRREPNTHRSDLVGVEDPHPEVSSSCSERCRHSRDRRT